MKQEMQITTLKQGNSDGDGCLPKTNSTTRGSAYLVSCEFKMDEVRAYSWWMRAQEECPDKTSSQ